MRIAIAKSATVLRHKQLIAMHASLAACVSDPPYPDPFWSTNIGPSGQECMWPTTFGPDQFWSGRTNFGC